MLPEKNLPHEYDCRRFESGSGRHMCPGFSARIDSLFVLVFAPASPNDMLFGSFLLLCLVVFFLYFCLLLRTHRREKLSKCIVSYRW